MNKEQKKFKKVIKKRAQSTRKKKLLARARDFSASRQHMNIVAYRKARKDVAKHNIGVTIARRNQLIKMLKIPDAEAKNYSNGYLDGLYEIAMKRTRK